MIHQFEKKKFHVTTDVKSPVGCTHGMLIYNKDKCAFCKETFDKETADAIRIRNAQRNS